jgi:BirA family biotin operon repressor/biotin-[acetyl-CoA-carboxylase] ligase
MGSPFDAPRCEALCRAHKLSLGTKVHFAHETKSTNDDAKLALSEGAAHGEVFVAAAQREGRGRRGADWFSPAGENLLFSVVVRFDLPRPRWGLLPRVVGLAVRCACERHGAEGAMLKWPNDVWVDGKKLAGILVESQFREKMLPAFVVGVGVNLLSRSFPPELRTAATSLALCGNEAPSFEQVLVDILAELESRLRKLKSDDFTPLKDELSRYHALQDKPISVGELAGTAQGIDDDGALLVALANGSVERVLSGAVTVRD